MLCTYAMSDEFAGTRPVWYPYMAVSTINVIFLEINSSGQNYSYGLPQQQQASDRFYVEVS